ncbi:polysaccharide biosynthesis protein [Proteocatella sphenisci]|uniref:polysaccharide biosynthesis protein n=1 Tax=Proteocatella sphenisci TaxID=181070 RepID=UPI00048A95AB|nr:nucleoside-diphosphate sugar epimerase/dehydratase [Proteocatella sphenisci]
MNTRQKIFSRRSTLMLIDMAIAGVGYFFAYVMTLNNEQVISYIPLFKQTFFLFIVIYLIVYYFMGIYGQMWRYADADEYQLCSVASIFAGGIFIVLSELASYNVPVRIQIAAPLIVMGIVIASRITYKTALQQRKRLISSIFSDSDKSEAQTGHVAKKRLAIIGAGDAGVQLLKEIKNNPNLKYEPVCFVDDNPKKTGRSILGIPIYGPTDKIQEIVKRKKIEKIIIAMPSLESSDKKRIVEQCSDTKCKVKILPGIPLVLKSHDDKTELMGRLRNINVEDLLSRDSIKVNEVDIESYIKGKNILVTGGGGSIGSEICRQAVNFGAKRLVIIDNYENNAYDIEQELKRDYGYVPQVEIITVREKDTLDKFFCNFKDKYGKIDVVFHAAAHKHVPLMEHNPDQAVMNNILGTYNVATMCDKYGVGRMILVSTDKAVNPTNVMGATKRACEMVIQAMNKKSKHTRYAAVRFGNVLGSNGSVIPLFKKQIEKGGPVTVTHPDIIRYFMTIPEAVSLVLNAGGMAKGGEIFVLDMGDPVKITDLADNMIKLAGLTAGKDINIEFTGLRPGEKLFEELLMAEEGITKTDSAKIFIGKPNEVREDKIFEWIQDVEHNMKHYNSTITVSKLKELVDTFKTPEEINEIAG